MSTFGSVLNIARTALAAHQAALQTVSHNLANAETEGYSRQRAELVPRPPQQLPYANVGTGTMVTNVVRLRSELLDNAYRREVGTRDAWTLRHDLLAEAEGIFAEPSDTGLGETLDQFWNAWSDLANSPASGAAQSVVRQRGVQLVTQLNSYATRIADLGIRVHSELAEQVKEINTLAGQLADLNRQVTAAEVDGVQAPDLRDSRDRIADRLAQIAGARSEVQANGTMAVYLRGNMLVDATNARTLEVRTGATISLGFRGDPDPIPVLTGPLGARVDLVNIDLPALTTRLDAFARGLVNGVNEFHRSGWTVAGEALGNANWNPLNGPTGSMVNFFDPTATSAGSIRLSAEVAANTSVIAAGDVLNAPGNNNVAMALAALRDDNGMNALRTRMGAAFAAQVGFGAGESYIDHHARTIADLGTDVSEAHRQQGVYETLARQADNRRASVAGVSIDEELTLMLRHQQAYAAATKLVQTADEMAAAILAMV